MRVGIDSVEIDRINNCLKNERFITRVFSEEEILLFKQRNFKTETIAANFAAKEAFSKALGTGIRNFSLNEAALLRDESGAPYLKLTGRANKLAKGLSFTVSVTHTRTTATVIIIAYETNED